ncbi:MAG: FecR domain-containing protein [Nitrospirota bacterium]|nr:FecR domain-containing protein [Nitrospirota bacterium]
MRLILTRLLIPSTLLFLLPVFISSNSMAAERCEVLVAKVVSVQGIAEVRLTGDVEWRPIKLNSTFCPGDMLRLMENSRAAIVLSNETIIRLDQNTTIMFSGIEKKETSLLDLIRGAIHFLSRVPRTLKVITPYVNASVEGTEFLVRVDKGQTFVSVFEGKVLASNNSGSLTLTEGQSAVAEEGKAPVLKVVVNPRDAVQWALYYPPVMEYPGELTEDETDPLYLTYRASLMLSVGRVEEALRYIERALSFAPDYAQAIALQSVIFVVQNDKERALVLARKAVNADPSSAAALIALSYAQQANFDLKGALRSLRKAVRAEPENSLAWARLSEMWLSFGYLDKALVTAHKAVDLNPDLSRTQTVLGFAYLAQVKVREARDAFEKAIELDQADPLARLGLGLAKIRQGYLREGRREIEIAVSLDTNQSIIRSYLGKAYYEEKREKFSKDQYGIARELDPLDPTPFFYDAILKQSINRPVEALHDMQKAIELNDNRGVYRSKLLLDDDLAARSASIARIYSDLGFQRLALVEGWKSVNTDPKNYSAHRLLADTYASQPRHEIARVSELLQSQLLQPLNITPVQPQLAESNLFIFDRAGPGDLSFNEFNSLFNRNRLALQLSGVYGGNATFGNEIVASGVYDRFSLSTGQFHYETDGFRENNDLREDIYNIFTQYNISYKTSIQAEYRYKNKENGNLSLNFDPDAFFPARREEDHSQSIRLGFRHSITPNSEIIASAIHQSVKYNFFVSTPDIVPGVPSTREVELNAKESGYLGEIQHLYNAERLHIISGFGHFTSDVESETTTTVIIPPLPAITSPPALEENDVRHTNLYVYTHINYPDALMWTVGGSADFFDNETIDKNQFNPKIGLTWTLPTNTTLRGAVFRTLKRQLISNQTIEPTQVAGFNQFFDDANGTDAWRYGIAIDQKFTQNLFSGAEFSRRKMDVPFKKLTILPPPSGPVTENKVTDWEEDLFRVYLYWSPLSWLALSEEYQYEKFDREDFFVDDIKKLETTRIPIKVSLFFPLGLIAHIKTTYVDQTGEFFNPILLTTVEDSDSFWVVDASIRYRLPKRYGMVSIEARNLFDEKFKFQDTDSTNPSIYPERLILAKVTLAF